jgi:hypothetical protein
LRMQCSSTFLSRTFLSRAVTAHPRALVHWRSDSDGVDAIKPEEAA